MSYSLFLHFKPRLRRADILDYFARRRHYKLAKTRVSYGNEDTGVYFWFQLSLGWDFLLRRTVKSLEFELNYNRPSFFGLEAEQELSDFIDAFHPRIEDPQMEGLGTGAYSRDGFLRGWNFGNRLAIGQIATEGSERKIATMPAAALRAAWEWNYRCADQREKRKQQSYVPSILFWRIDGRVCRVAAWGESIPILLPRVDYVFVAREAAGKVQGTLALWTEIVALAQRAGFDTGKEPLELRYLTPPPVIAAWAANLSLSDLNAYEQLPAHQIIDEELIAGAPES